MIPKSTHKERIIENFNIFDFKVSEEDSNALVGMRGGRLPDYWNPLTLPVDTGKVK